MLIAGIACLLIGFFAHIGILWIIGIVLVVLGAVLLVADRAGHTVGGRRYY